MAITRTEIYALIAIYEEKGMVSRQDDLRIESQDLPLIYNAICETHQTATQEIFSDANGDSTPVIYDPEIFDSGVIKDMVEKWTT